MYLSYADFQNMGGTLNETTFNDIAFQASSIINYYTFNRLKKDSSDYSNVPEEVKRCMYRIINLILEQQALANSASADSSSIVDGVEKSIASQSNDGVSISYNILSAKDAMDNAKSEIVSTIQQYLAYTINSLGQKVLYRGFYPGE